MIILTEAQSLIYKKSNCMSNNIYMRVLAATHDPVSLIQKMDPPEK